MNKAMDLVFPEDVKGILNRIAAVHQNGLVQLLCRLDLTDKELPLLFLNAGILFPVIVDTDFADRSDHRITRHRLEACIVIFRICAGFVGKDGSRNPEVDSLSFLTLYKRLRAARFLFLEGNDHDAVDAARLSLFQYRIQIILKLFSHEVGMGIYIMNVFHRHFPRQKREKISSMSCSFPPSPVISFSASQAFCRSTVTRSGLAPSFSSCSALRIASAA